MSSAVLPAIDEAWLVESMAQAVGQDKARDAIRRAAAKLGLGAGELAPRHAASVLAEVTKESGLVGLVARRLLARLSSATPPGGPVRHSSGTLMAVPGRDALPEPPAAPLDASRVSVDELVGLLERGLGRERSRTLVEGALATLGVRGAGCTRDQALAALERLADEPGIVGITARFAMPRLLLRSG